jgi:hypothetical protein
MTETVTPPEFVTKARSGEEKRGEEKKRKRAKRKGSICKT